MEWEAEAPVCVCVCVYTYVCVCRLNHSKDALEALSTAENANELAAPSRPTCELRRLRSVDRRATSDGLGMDYDEHRLPLFIVRLTKCVADNSWQACF